MKRRMVSHGKTRDKSSRQKSLTPDLELPDL